MSKATRATRALDAAGVAYELFPYDYAADAAGKGVQAAEALGAPPRQVFKTLMAKVDGRPVCAAIPVHLRLQPKLLAAACAGKSAQMMEAAEAERLSGYKVGGISPFGQQRPLPTLLDRRALDEPAIYLNAGQRGLMLRIATDAAVTLLQARVVHLAD